MRKLEDRMRAIEEIKAQILQTLNEGPFLTTQTAPKQEASSSKRPKLLAKTLKDLRVAAIMDRFTLDCFSPECTLLELTPDGWRDEMDNFGAELLFIESAWEGKDGLWHGKVVHCSPELYDLTGYCHERGIPVIFWNKEDPTFIDSFMPTANQADAVYTGEIECIERYKTTLGHDRVYHLHFAAQPDRHNPIEKMERKDKFCFAGAYYHRYAERCKVFDAFSEYFFQERGLDIYDRNYPEPRPEHKFPEQYDSHILGKLDPAEIDVAYKGYTFGINMNSAPQAQTMFARRVFELMASNTIVVGNYNRGVKNYFGDLTICTDDVDTLKEQIASCGEGSTLHKWRLLGLRKVLREHLCADRLDFIVREAYGESLLAPLPSILVVAAADDAAQCDRARKQFLRQSYENASLLLVGGEPQAAAHPRVRCLSREAAGAYLLQDCGQDYVALFDSADWYGENYLLDLALTTRYGSFSAIGKASYYAGRNGGVELVTDSPVYRTAECLPARRAIAASAALDGDTAASLLEGPDWKLSNMLAVDEFNYCANWMEDECPEAADLQVADQGIPLARINETAARIQSLQQDERALVLEAKDIIRASIPRGAPITIRQEGNEAVLHSDLPDGQHQYLFFPEALELAPLLSGGKLPIQFSGSGDLDLICGCQYLDEKQCRLTAQYPHFNRFETLTPPEGAKYVLLLLRPKGKGTAKLKSVSFADTPASLNGSCLLLRSDTLVLTNNYPRADDLYRNMFVHTRVRSYKESGVVLDVMRMKSDIKPCFREFDGINVTETEGGLLTNALSGGTLHTVCVHFLDQHMWDILYPYLSHLRLIIWIHGADIQPWWRRAFNYETKSERENAEKLSEKTMAFWRQVFEASKRLNIHFVFVSQSSANDVMEDYNIQLPTETYSIIHNYIDTNRFTYTEKNAEQRTRLFTVKSFGSNKYGNDITAKAIVELSKRPFFDELSFYIYGDGVLFDKVNKPLQKFKNVYLHKQYLTQSEIAALHQRCGVYIATTRNDTQGVSRDEAMASGLVPIANEVTAIPEFVDSDCGLLVPAEDYTAVADAVERLYNDPDLFLRLSKNAAARVRWQSPREKTIGRELILITTGKLEES